MSGSGEETPDLSRRWQQVYGDRLGVIVIRLISLDLRPVRFADPGLRLVADASILPFEKKKSLSLCVYVCVCVSFSWGLSGATASKNLVVLAHAKRAETY